MRLLWVGLFSVSTFAAIIPETEGMEGVSRGDGTFLTASPTYVWDRPSGSDGIHASSELFSTDKLGTRLLLNRFSVTPSWKILEPGVWLSTGNEIGDMIYQDLLDDSKELNRTPLLEGGFRSPSFHGFFATVRYFQVDHYSSNTMYERKKNIGSAEYSWFGENLPFFSTLYGGLGYEQGKLKTSLVAGQEYLWIFGESGHWVPVKYSPRVEGNVEYGAFSSQIVFENGEYQNKKKKESGERQELSGFVRYQCKDLCDKGIFAAGGGLAFRTTNSEGDVNFILEDDFVVWPFFEFRFKPDSRFKAEVSLGANEKDWLVQDSLEFYFTPDLDTDILVGLGSRLGSRLNPLGEDFEVWGKDTISLAASSGYFQIHRAYMDISEKIKAVTLGGHLTGWIEEGAETFDTLSTSGSTKNPFRNGNVSRIESWIYGVSGELRAAFKLGDLFALETRGGFERIEGKERQFEVNPAEGWVAISGLWNFDNHLIISQSLNYRSDARWNLRYSTPLVVKGDWFWNISLIQNFPSYGLTLSGTLLHIIGKDFFEVPGGGLDRTRFYCTIKKSF